MKPRYTKAHVDEVSARLRRYEEVLKAPEFQPLEWCDVCETVDDAPGKPGCFDCLFATPHPEFPGDMRTCMSGPGPCGGSCTTRDQQRLQFRFLKLQLRRNGWRFE